MTCQQKVRYPSRHRAEQHLAADEHIGVVEKNVMNIYRCGCGGFHIGHRSLQAAETANPQTAPSRIPRFTLGEMLIYKGQRVAL